MKITPPSSHKNARVIRIVAFNALLMVVGLALIAIAGEVYFRLMVVPNGYGLYANPQDFVGHTGWRFVSDVGIMPDPNSEVRHTNHMDYWAITQTNGIGFLDREPISPGRAAESCHIALIGDSFIQAKEVHIADKAQVKLEELAARELPHLDITTSAFGQGGVGQINQLAFYDEYAQHLKPKVVALAFVHNDFQENFTISRALRLKIDPDHLPVVTAARGADGALELRPPDPDYEAFRLPRPLPNQAQTSSGDDDAVKSYIASFFKRALSPVRRANMEIAKYSYFAKWLDAKTLSVRSEWMFGKEAETLSPELIAWREELLSRWPRYIALIQGQTQPDAKIYIDRAFAEAELPPALEDALDYTKFGLEQFKQRADQDGAKLVILATHAMMSEFGNLSVERLYAVAEDLDIPVINQHEYIVSIDADPRNGEFKHDYHWNKDGHRWAAEVLLEWLKDNQEVCD